MFSDTGIPTYVILSPDKTRPPTTFSDRLGVTVGMRGTETTLVHKVDKRLKSESQLESLRIAETFLGDAEKEGCEDRGTMQLKWVERHGIVIEKDFV